MFLDYVSVCPYVVGGGTSVVGAGVDAELEPAWLIFASCVITKFEIAKAESVTTSPITAF